MDFMMWLRKLKNVYNTCKILTIIPRYKNNWVLIIIIQSAMITGTTCAQMSFIWDLTQTRLDEEWEGFPLKDYSIARGEEKINR